MRTDEHLEAVATLEAALTDPALDEAVELTLTSPAPDTYRATAADGSVTFRRDARSGRPTYDVAATKGRNPLADQAADRFVGHDHEQATRFPHRTANAYPHAYDSVAQFFDSPHAPDLVAVHTAHHHFDEHLGQHGSPGVVQARAPFLAAGAGIRARGVVERSTRIVDVAPTIATLLGVEPHPDGRGPTGERRTDARLRRQDGDPDADLLDGSPAAHVVVFLLDGCNANLFAEVIAAGEAPNLAALLDRGTSYAHGAMASLPTATLANHTTGVTGVHPGHSGVLHNTWHDRGGGHTPDLLSMDQMFWASSHLHDDVETLHEAVHRTRPGAWTSATFEFCDRGASFSTFAILREGTPPFPHRDEIRHVDPDQRDASPKYAFMSMIDHVSTTHTVEGWEQRHGNPLPTLSWCSLAVTDEAGHESGPHGAAARAAVRDSDARIGDVLGAVERAGALDDTAVFVIADHGMEQNDPENTTSWDEAVKATGIEHLDVGHGFFYVR